MMRKRKMNIALAKSINTNAIFAHTKMSYTMTNVYAPVVHIVPTNAIMMFKNFCVRNTLLLSVKNIL